MNPLYASNNPPADETASLYYLGLPVQLPPALDDFRRRFDPKYAVNEAHATLVAPFPAKLMTEDLSNYFQKLLAEYPAQTVVAQGYHVTSCGYLFYTFDDTASALLLELYNRLYEHPTLAARKETRHTFLPHITVGKFADAKSIPESVISELATLCTPYALPFDRLQLYAILSEPKKRARVRDYLLRTRGALEDEKAFY